MPRANIALAFSASGHLLVYQLGVARALLASDAWAPRLRAFVGASGGAIAATVCALYPQRLAEFAET